MPVEPTGLTSRGRDGHCCPPPARIPAGGFPAPGSCLRYDVASIWMVVGMSIYTCLAHGRARGLGLRTLVQFCAWGAILRAALPLARRLPSIRSVAAATGRPCSQTSPVLCTCPTSRARSSTATAPRLSAADRSVIPRPDTRSPRFRRVPFARDGVFDHGRVSFASHTGLLMLPSTSPNVSASAVFRISRLNSPPHAIAVYASLLPSPTATQHSLPGGRYSLPGLVSHQLDHASFAWRTGDHGGVTARSDGRQELPASPA